MMQSRARRSLQFYVCVSGGGWREGGGGCRQTHGDLTPLCVGKMRSQLTLLKQKFYLFYLSLKLPFGSEIYHKFQGGEREGAWLKNHRAVLTALTKLEYDLHTSEKVNVAYFKLKGFLLTNKKC